MGDGARTQQAHQVLDQPGGARARPPQQGSQLERADHAEENALPIEVGKARVEAGAEEEQAGRDGRAGQGQIAPAFAEGDAAAAQRPHPEVQE